MTIYDLFETDVDLEKKGVTVKITEAESVTVAAFGNENHAKILERLKKPYKQQYRKGTVDEKVDEDIHVRAMSQAVLLGWEGIKDKLKLFGDDPEALVPYSQDNAYKLLSEPRMKRFKGLIVELAASTETYKKQEEEDAVKNSQAASSGS